MKHYAQSQFCFIRLNTLFHSLLLASSLSIASTVNAEIYRIVDKDGSVSYTDQKPVNSTVKDIEPDIDEQAKRNTSASPETVSESHPDWLKEAQEKRKKAAEEKAKLAAENKQPKLDYKAAKKALKKAKKDQKKGAEAVEGDFVGKAGKGVRLSEKYHERQKALKQAVQDAKAQLKKQKK